MKDYSQYIKSRYGFINEYSIGDDGKTYLYTPNMKKSHPNDYKTTPERVAKFEERLENQYKLVIQNKDTIIKDKSTKARKIIYPIGLIFIIVCITLGLAQAPLLYTSSLFISGILAMGVGEIAISLNRTRFEEKVKLYDEYIQNRQKIENLSKNDKNITTHLNDKTREMLNRNEALRKQETIQNAFNIGLMDKMELKELKELLLRYKINQALESEQTFITPKEQRAKTRKKVKNNN